MQHTRYRVKGRPKVASQTVEAVTSNGRDWYPDEAEDEEAEEDEDTAFRRYLTGAPGANLTDGVLDKLVETRETKLEELLQILEAGADDPGFVGARDVLVNALLVLVLTAVHRAQQDLEEEGREITTLSGIHVQEARRRFCTAGAGFVMFKSGRNTKQTIPAFSRSISK